MSDDADNQIVFANGLRAIKVDHDEKGIAVILPEGWTLLVLPADSGLAVDVETKRLAEKNFVGVAKIKTKRMHPAPVIEGMRDYQAESVRSLTQAGTLTDEKSKEVPCPVCCSKMIILNQRPGYIFVGGPVGSGFFDPCDNCNATGKVRA